MPLPINNWVFKRTSNGKQTTENPLSKMMTGAPPGDRRGKVPERYDSTPSLNEPPSRATSSPILSKLPPAVPRKNSEVDSLSIRSSRAPSLKQIHLSATDMRTAHVFSKRVADSIQGHHTVSSVAGSIYELPLEGQGSEASEESPPLNIKPLKTALLADTKATFVEPSVGCLPEAPVSTEDLGVPVDRQVSRSSIRLKDSTKKHQDHGTTESEISPFISRLSSASPSTDSFSSVSISTPTSDPPVSAPESVNPTSNVDAPMRFPVSSLSIPPPPPRSLPPPVIVPSTPPSTPQRKLDREQSPPVSTKSSPTLFMADPTTVLCRLFNNPLYSDLSLVVDETTFYVHRGILSEHCSFFRNLFGAARTHEPTSTIKQLDCSFKAVSAEDGGPPKDRIVEVTSRSDGLSTSDRTKYASAGQYSDENRSPEGDDDDDGSDEVHYEDAKEFSDQGQCCGEKGRGSSLVPSILDDDLSKVPKPRAHTVVETNQSPENFDTIPSALFSNDKMAGNAYTDRHFAKFLQIIYCILDPSDISEVDLLPVFRISHVFGVPGLTELLGDMIYDSVVLSVEIWPSILIFAERYHLESIKEKALEFASQTRALWTVAVETLSLEDFKAFLRGLQSESPGVKDELLMMFLLVNFQGNTSSTSSSNSEEQEADHRDNPGSAHVSQPRHQHRPVSHHSSTALLRRTTHSRRRTAPMTKIQQQLQQQHYTSLSPSAPMMPTRSASIRRSARTRGQEVEMGAGLGRGSMNHLAVIPRKLGTLEKAEKAKGWMRRFKLECGWDGKVSFLD